MHDLGPCIEPHPVVGHAAIEQVAIQLRKILKRRDIIAGLQQSIGSPLHFEPPALGNPDSLVRIFGEHRFLPMVIYAQLFRANVGIAVGQIPVITDTQALQFLPKLSGEDGIRRLQII